MNSKIGRAVKAPHIAHVINPFAAPEGTSLSVAQPITFETMRRARSHADHLSIELMAVTFPEEQAVVPTGFKALHPLDRSVLDFGNFKHPKRLPILRDILDRMFAATDAELLVYTNADIALMPNFYNSIWAIYKNESKAFVVNRRTISEKYTDISKIDLMQTEVGFAHPGHDCFVFPNSLYEKFNIGNVCIGATGVGRALLFDLIAHESNFTEYSNRHLTYHLGNDAPWAAIEMQAYMRHNFQENRIQLESLWRGGNLRDHPLIHRGITQMRNRFKNWDEPPLPENLFEPSPVDQVGARDYSIRFVCHGGELEIKALLLVLSLRQHLPDIELIACTPAASLGFAKISEQTLLAFQSLKVTIAEVQNPFGQEYPIANKLAAFLPPTRAKYKIFLDSDILCQGDFISALPGNIGFAAVAADRKTTSATQEDWRKIYGAAGLELPKQRIRATLSQEEMYPYYNAGVIVADATLPVSETWTALACAVDDLPDIPDKRPHLDQIALPVAVARMAVAPTLLDPKFNLPAHLRTVPNGALLVHYHFPQCIKREPVLRNQVRTLAAESPQLTALMKADDNWSPILKPSLAVSGSGRPLQLDSPVPPERNLIVTGIPRSGTSYLCQLLHCFENCVVINEPAEISRPLRGERYPYGLGVVYNSLRQQILDGEPVKNKLLNGKLVSDTAKTHEVTYYNPEVNRPDFVLGTKNTLSYLARLESIRTILPGAKIVACIRNPWDTIASWKTSFPHLRDAAVHETPIIGLKSAFLTPPQRARLQGIAALESVAERRAAFWAYLADILLAQIDHVTLVRYEDLVTEPGQIANTIVSNCFGMDPGDITVTVPPASPSDKQSVLDEADLEAIDKFCSTSARLLGLAARRF